MRVMEIQGFGGPEVLQPGERPEPSPGPGEVVVRVMATSVNPVDTKIRRTGRGDRPGPAGRARRGCRRHRRGGRRRASPGSRPATRSMAVPAA